VSRDRCIRAGLEPIDDLSGIAEDRTANPTDDLNSVLIHTRLRRRQHDGSADLLAS